jgi:hypothetical protein
MKRLLLYFFIGTFLNGCSQKSNDDSTFFEGIIEYQIIVAELNENISESDLRKVYGTKLVLTVNKDFYMTTSDAERYSYQLYSKKDNKLYSMHNVGDTLFVTDTEGHPTVPFEELNTVKDTTIKKIAGYDCVSLEIKDDYVSRTYYYSQNLSVNPALYENHDLGNKSEIYPHINSLFLKMIVANNYNNTGLIIEAIKVTEKKINPDEFKIPEHIVKINE